jgi:uncharacterized protein (TIGR03083 family)
MSSSEDYLKSVQADVDVVLALLGRDAERQLPTCPEWTMRDLAAHLAVVYLHKTACTRLLAEPRPWPPATPEQGIDAWLRDARDEMLEVFRAAGPSAPSHTWHGPDQTVGFWMRRMAVETAVHRVDAELAFGPAAPLDEELAAAGIDEALDIMLAGDWSDEPQPGRAETVLLTTPERGWRVRMAPELVEIEHGAAPGEAGEGVVAGSASEVLLWLWRRIGTDEIATEGDAKAVARLRDWMAIVT